MIRDEETDLSFLDFVDGPSRPDPLDTPMVESNKEAPSRKSARGLGNRWRARHDSNVRPPAPQAEKTPKKGG